MWKFSNFNLNQIYSPIKVWYIICNYFHGNIKFINETRFNLWSDIFFIAACSIAAFTIQS